MGELFRDPQPPPEQKSGVLWTGLVLYHKEIGVEGCEARGCDTAIPSDNSIVHGRYYIPT